MSFENVKSDDDYVTEDLKASAKLSSELAMDISNGVGPDILMNTSSFGQLNSDNCLVDLSPYFQDLDSDKYYKNIIDGAKNDGKLYQLPVCFSIEGIQTDKNNTGKSGVGFTVEEYKQFLYDTLNGADAIELGQNNYFALLFNNMKDSFIKEGKADLSKTEFAELAQYVKENVKQNSQLWSNEPVDTEEVNDSRTVLINKAYHCDCPGISGYLVKRARVQDGTAILGLPSSPLTAFSLSVAVQVITILEPAFAPTEESSAPEAEPTPAPTSQDDQTEENDDILNDLTDEETIDLFVEAIMDEKGVNAPTEEIKEDIKKDLKNQLLQEIDRSLIMELPEDKLEELNRMATANGQIDPNVIANMIKDASLDVTEIVGTTMARFREIYLNGADNEQTTNENTEV